MKTIFAFAALAASSALAGCAGQGVTDTLLNGAGAVASAVQPATTSSQIEVTTYADAVMAADFVTNTADLVVATGKLSRATLDGLDQVSDAVHDEFVKLKAAHAAGQSLAFQAFRDALGKFEAYRQANGIPAASAKPAT